MADDLPDFGALIDRIDDAVDEAWNALRGKPAIDRLFYSASFVADFSALWHAVGIAQSVTSGDPRVALRLSGALGMESALVNGAIKSLFKRQRPVAQVARPLYLRIPKTSSFPSGHASSAFMAATLLAKRNPRLAPAYYLLATIVGTSRIHVRIHHASDIAAGTVVGIALGRIVHAVSPLPKRR